MNNRLHIRFEQLEQATTRMLNSVAELGEKAYQAPGEKQWSAAQVVQHLVISETAIGQYLEKKLLQEEGHQRAGIGTFLKSKLLRLALRLPFTRFRAPSFLDKLMPATAPPLSDLRAEWEAVRRRMERLLNEFPGKLVNHAIFKHPRSGMLTIQQTLDFMLDHILHHQQQIERIKKAVS
ncbi:DinB family protein [Hymenobacter wooponensis]|uniref:DinB family protein n=1 Tax=Hymenobacter wooponensis TaxID=1525360 RepID=A0A4Z0MMI1_9BACT|nr:DinB family protein [Hymenobacter wooponensis]TGD80791.1 DinB family protein [Hymenobacter wooponensis]